MSVRIDNQLVQVYIQDAMQDAAQARAERNAKPARTKINSRETIFALAAAGVPVVIWLIQVFRTK